MSYQIVQVELENLPVFVNDVVVSYTTTGYLPATTTTPEEPSEAEIEKVEFDSVGVYVDYIENLVESGVLTEEQSDAILAIPYAGCLDKTVTVYKDTNRELFEAITENRDFKEEFEINVEHAFKQELNEWDGW